MERKEKDLGSRTFSSCAAKPKYIRITISIPQKKWKIVSSWKEFVMRCREEKQNLIKIEKSHNKVVSEQELASFNDDGCAVVLNRYMLLMFISLKLQNVAKR
jgi:hypothetical protein